MINLSVRCQSNHLPEDNEAAKEMQDKIHDYADKLMREYNDRVGLVRLGTLCPGDKFDMPNNVYRRVVACIGVCWGGTRIFNGQIPVVLLPDYLLETLPLDTMVRKVEE